jgi:aminomethyltransferase
MSSAPDTAEADPDLKQTPLAALNAELGARMVPFAGYQMPVQYKAGILAEHNQVRQKAGLFDISHMGQIRLLPRSGAMQDAALALESLVPMDILGLKPGRQRYAFFTNESGGILDDLMVAHKRDSGGDHLLLVVNAACKHADLAHLRAHLSDACDIDAHFERALLALQGPRAESVLSAHQQAVKTMRFMDVIDTEIAGRACTVSRSGYTGEDGFEISVAAEGAEALARALLDHPDCEPIGLGARDSLRLEAGLCLYGSDITEQTSPIEADLAWAIQKARRSGGDRPAGFPGADHILSQLDNGASRRRVGLRPEGRAPVRAGTELFAGETGTAMLGHVTSGGFGPSIGGPVAMGYVPTAQCQPSTRIFAELRGRRVAVEVASLPFVASNYKR